MYFVFPPVPAEYLSKGGFFMRKFIAVILVLCLVLGLSSAALAAGAPKITKQPTSQTTDKNGKVTFSFRAKNYNSKDSGWRFVNPATGEEFTGPQVRDMLEEVKGSLSVSNGKQTMTLKKVPESMHGWDVYFVLVNNGYTISTDRVKLWCYGLQQTEGAATPTDSEPASAAQPATPSEPAAVPDAGAEAAPAAEAEPAPRPVTVAVGEKLTLMPLDSRGEALADQAAASFTFEGAGSFAVRAESPVRYWVVNGIRIEPVEGVTSFTLKNVTSDLQISARFEQAAAAPAAVDPDHPCQVTCTGAVFTYHAGGLSSVASGSVPSGASVIVAAAPGSDTSAGYTVNGQAGQNAGKSNFMLVITGDTVISLP